MSVSSNVLLSQDGQFLELGGLAGEQVSKKCGRLRY